MTLCVKCNGYNSCVFHTKICRTMQCLCLSLSLSLSLCLSFCHSVLCFATFQTFAMPLPLSHSPSVILDVEIYQG